MLSRSEEYRKFFSWNMSILFMMALLLLSKPQAEGGAYFAYYLVEVSGYLLIISATLGRVWCALYITGRKNKVLCKDGPYSICRNPSYLFTFFGVMGIVTVAQSLFLLFLIIPVFWTYYYLVIKSEERRLWAIFGEEYEDYCSRVKRLLPRFSNYWSKTIIEINPQVTSKSIIDAGWFLWFLVLFELLKPIKVYAAHSHVLLSILQHFSFLSGLT
jgi:protein-S-isoprenylcysteine O-methyltransferase Ste14